MRKSNELTILEMNTMRLAGHWAEDQMMPHLKTYERKAFKSAMAKLTNAQVELEHKEGRRYDGLKHKFVAKEKI